MKGDFKVIIYTNYADSFYKEFEKNNFEFLSKIIVEEISKSTVNDWVYNGYPYTIKIKVIEHFFNKYKANALFIDSDFYIKNDITPLYDMIENKEFVMYKYARPVYLTALLGIEDIGTFYTFLKHPNYAVKRHHIHYFSGVLGINYKYKNVLDDVYALCCQFYKITRNHSSEEIAFSYVFQNIGKINVAKSFFTGYGSQQFKRIFIGYTFNTFFENDKRYLEELLALFNLKVDFLNELNFTYDDLKYLLNIFYKHVNADFENIKNIDQNRYDEYMAKYNDALKNQLSNTP